MMDIKAEIGDLKTALVETGVDVGPAIYLARVFDTDVDSVVKYFIFMLIAVFDPLAVVLVISYNLTLQVRMRDENDSPIAQTTPEKKKKKKPKRLGLYKEGKTMLEKVVKETFSPDAEKKSNKVIKDFVKKAPDEDERFKKGSELIEEEPGGGVFEPDTDEFGRGAVLNKDYKKIIKEKT
jgi:ribosomal protein L3